MIFDPLPCDISQKTKIFEHKQPLIIKYNTNMDQNNDTFNLFGIEFSKEHFPEIYCIYKNDPAWAHEQVKSVADAWHEGDISSAVIAFETDLNKY